MSSVKVKLDLSRFRRNLTNAQFRLSNQVLADCKAIMPLDTGNLQQRSYVSKDNMQVVFPGPYGRYLYYGNKMVNAVTGKGPMKIPNVGLRYRKGTKLKVKEPIEKLQFTRPEAQERWFEVAKTNHLKDWQKLVKEELIKK